MTMKRPSKADYYLDIALSVSRRATCLRRGYGAIIVSKQDEVISSGYNGATRGAKDCLERGVCKRQELHVPSGERYELCRSVHGEQNAIISASRRDMVGGTLYLAGIDMQSGEVLDTPEPCMLCRRFIINAGIEKVVMMRKDGCVTENVSDWVEGE